NFIGGAPVTLILRGNHVPATARVVDDPALIAMQNTLTPLMQAWPQMMFFPRPMPMKVPGVAQ
ncbi:MAG: hypothetical protein NZO58_14445, partial [Gemmataceae bacterium]|nr:hypothetical protein [Gemmataceae bacterium]